MAGGEVGGHGTEVAAIPQRSGKSGLECKL